MIRLHDVNKHHWLGNTQKPAVVNASAQFERGQSIGILGGHGSGKTTLLSLISGMSEPDSGYIDRSSSVSWILGSQRVFSRNISYRSNIRITSLMYGADPAAVLTRILRVVDLRPLLDADPRDTPRSLQLKFSYVLCLAMDFDYYLIDENLSPSDPWTRFMLRGVIHARRGRSGFIITSRQPDIIRKYTDVAYTMRKGHLHAHDTFADAVRSYEA